MKEILIVASAPGGHALARRWLASRPHIEVCLVNEEIAAWKWPAHYAATLHPEKLADWLARRAAMPDLCTGDACVAPTVWLESSVTYRRAIGTSTHLAYIAAVQNGFDLVYLAGATMDGPSCEYARPIWRRAKRDGELAALGDVLSRGWLRDFMTGEAQ